MNVHMYRGQGTVTLCIVMYSLLRKLMGNELSGCPDFDKKIVIWLRCFVLAILQNEMLSYSTC